VRMLGVERGETLAVILAGSEGGPRCVKTVSMLGGERAEEPAVGQTVYLQVCGQPTPRTNGAYAGGNTCGRSGRETCRFRVGPRCVQTASMLALERADEPAVGQTENIMNKQTEYGGCTTVPRRCTNEHEKVGLSDIIEIFKQNKQTTSGERAQRRWRHQRGLVC
jgi:hypothetical protein